MVQLKCEKELENIVTFFFLFKALNSKKKKNKKIKAANGLELSLIGHLRYR